MRSLSKTTVHLFLGVVLTGAAVMLGGCNQARGLAQINPMASQPTRAIVQTEPDVSEIVFEPTPVENEVALVRQTSATSPSLPTLMTLEAGNDLNETVALASGTVVLDFYADWCGPCRKQGKILKELESVAEANQVHIIQVNVDEHPELARQMNVASLPTLMKVQNGEIVDRQTGLADKGSLMRWMK